MFAGLGLLLLAVPIVELIVIVKVGDVIGFWPTLALLIGVSIAGTALLKREGVATWRRLQASLQRGEMPTEEVTDGALILLGGALLLTPGFVTDIAGLLMIFPLTRSTAKGLFRKMLGFAAVKRFLGTGTASLPSAPPRPSGEDDPATPS